MRTLTASLIASLCVSSLAHGAHVDRGRLVLDKGDTITIVGNTFAERMIHHPHFEAAVQVAHPEHELLFRNLAWSGDEVALQPRPLNFGSVEDRIRATSPNVLVACFGMNESFGGLEGLRMFRTQLGQWLDQHQAMKIDGVAPVIVLVSPIAHEDLGPPLPDGRERNFILAKYRDVMRSEAIKRGALFVDLLRPMQRAMATDDGPWTINGIHPNDAGYVFCAEAMGEQLGLPLAVQTPEPGVGDPLVEAIKKRNDLFFQRWRPVNTEYVYGRRHRPYGNQNFPGEMEELDRLVSEGDTEIHSIAQEQAVKE
ncbi:MAG: SGNH/GDSL hydrolase family protein [Phycisphaerales bacterium]|nr:SGNH/GDSL hydrolase family protein [Phycisphaerales bacterium]